jgi:hypothetical protein
MRRHEQRRAHIRVVEVRCRRENADKWPPAWLLHSPYPGFEASAKIGLGSTVQTLGQDGVGRARVDVELQHTRQ